MTEFIFCERVLTIFTKIGHIFGHQENCNKVEIIQIIYSDSTISNLRTNKLPSTTTWTVLKSFPKQLLTRGQQHNKTIKIIKTLLTKTMEHTKTITWKI